MNEGGDGVARVAKALYTRAYAHTSVSCWSDATRDDREHYQCLARAAVAALEANGWVRPGDACEVREAITDVLPHANYYFGTGARTAVSSETIKKYRRLVAARDLFSSTERSDDEV